MIEIYMTKDLELRQQILQALKANEGFCPCKIPKTADTKCMCKEFREQDEGKCSCGLYVKVINKD